MNEENLLAKIMTRIQQEKKIRQLQRRLILFSFTAVGSAFALAPTFNTLLAETTQSGIASYFSLLISDFAIVLSFWREFCLSILEIFPVMAVGIFLSTVFVFLISLKFLIKDYEQIFSIKNI
jgi:ABC-type phosphate/phosphonate transport system permease subunit